MKHFSGSRDVMIESDVDPARISPDAVLRPGCRIRGANTSIGPGCVLGDETPATVENCQLGRGVKLHGGFFSNAVFLDGSGMGSGAHVRAGTILEEQSGGAHAVGLKQTVLFPFVTLGSLINFCDVLMAGGTSRKNHSEVGSSYIHFNFTPHQDKVTASLIGDVPRGVLLNQKPVFLGGQGGLVGPARIAFGTVIAAGGVCRGDILEEDRLHVLAAPEERSTPFEPGVYKKIGRIVKNSLIYIGNIRALKAWYRQIRTQFVRDEFDRACLDGALANLDLILTERIERLSRFADKMKFSSAALEQAGGAEDLVAAQRKFAAAWPAIREALERPVTATADAVLTAEIKTADKTDYVAAIQSLSGEARGSAAAWLQSIVEESVSLL